MKSDKLFFISNYTADDVMITMDEGPDLAEDYAYFPKELLVPDNMAETICSMMARSEIHTIWMAGFVKPDMMEQVRETDNKLLSNKDKYINKGKALSKNDIIDFFDWLEMAIEEEDRVL